MDSKLQVLGELFVELFVVLSVLLDACEHFKTLFCNVFLHDLKDGVLLESFTRDVKWQVLRVYNTLDERQPVWNDVLAVVHDENSADIQLDVVLLLLVLEQVEWCTLWHEQQSSVLKGALHREVGLGKVFLPIVAEALVEVCVLLFSNVFGLAHPDWFDFVKGLELACDFLDLLCLLLFLFLDFFDLGLITFLGLFFFLVSLVIRVSDFLVGGLLDSEFNWE